MRRDRIYIAYNRRTATGWSKVLAEALGTRFGAERIVTAVAEEKKGEVPEPWRIRRTMRDCACVIALIDPAFALVTDRDGRLLIQDPAERVRIEIETALADPSIRVFPVLLDGTPLAPEQILPDTLHGLHDLRATEIARDGIDADLEPLIAVIERSLASAPIVGPEVGPGDDVAAPIIGGLRVARGGVLPWLGGAAVVAAVAAGAFLSVPYLKTLADGEAGLRGGNASLAMAEPPPNNSDGAAAVDAIPVAVPEGTLDAAVSAAREQLALRALPDADADATGAVPAAAPVDRAARRAVVAEDDGSGQRRIVMLPRDRKLPVGAPSSGAGAPRDARALAIRPVLREGDRDGLPETAAIAPAPNAVAGAPEPVASAGAPTPAQAPVDGTSLNETGMAPAARERMIAPRLAGSPSGLAVPLPRPELRIDGALPLTPLDGDLGETAGSAVRTGTVQEAQLRHEEALMPAGDGALSTGIELGALAVEEADADDGHAAGGGGLERRGEAISDGEAPLSAAAPAARVNGGVVTTVGGDLRSLHEDVEDDDAVGAGSAMLNAEALTEVEAGESGSDRAVVAASTGGGPDAAKLVAPNGAAGSGEDAAAVGAEIQGTEDAPARSEERLDGASLASLTPDELPPVSRPRLSNCRALLSSCEGGACVALRWAEAADGLAVCGEACMAGLSGQLEEAGATVSLARGPGGAAEPMCIGHSAADGGSPDGAACLLELLGPPFAQGNCPVAGHAYSVTAQ